MLTDIDDTFPALSRSERGRMSSRSGTTQPKGWRWSDDEITALRTYATADRAVLLAALPARTVRAIEKRASALHISLRRPVEISQNAQPLVRALYEEINSRDLSVIRIAEKAGVAPKTLKQSWLCGGNPLLGNFVAVLNTIGLDLAVVPLRKEP